MSKLKVETFYHVRCEYCGTPTSEYGYDDTRSEAIENAKLSGYRLLKGKNICSDCYQKYKKNKTKFMEENRYIFNEV